MINPPPIVLQKLKSPVVRTFKAHFNLIQLNTCHSISDKSALTLHEVTEVPASPKTIFNSFIACKKEQNTVLKSPKYCNTLTRSECILLAHVRVGKTAFNTEHYYKRTGRPVCVQLM